MRRLSAMPSLLAFDLDGTLAPLVPLPANAKVPAHTAAYLKALSRVWPLSVITGRAINDAKDRLGFTPQYLLGNHGAEREYVPASAAMITRLNRCREHFQRHKAAMQARWIVLEDKGLSLALHYSLCPNVPLVRTWLDRLIEPVNQEICTSHGHNVMNITPIDAPDKGDGLLDIMHDCRASHALVMGDDVNDEVAFEKAPVGSVTVRISSSQEPTQAKFRLSTQSQVDRVLTTLLALRR